VVVTPPAPRQHATRTLTANIKLPRDCSSWGVFARQLAQVLIRIGRDAWRRTTALLVLVSACWIIPDQLSCLR
jgi:hypothetical protein